ncbi:response regulator [Christiangramia salexigens]|uniref:Response regulator n=1 Tax=Christiangramia salexigens TaxID=1913577 RepID=A0A1L3J474_9FLAO|nr:response regulator [Christiangramia salexigens]APG59931.1 response regulator [Christiangramia salexigens]
MGSILLIDDQPITNFINKKLFQRQGIEEGVKDFTDPNKALEFLQDQKKALLFLDLNMPEMTGWEFLEKMKELDLNFKTIILTSSTSALDKQKAENYESVIDYITKPLSIEKFSKLSVSIEDYSYKST